MRLKLNPENKELLSYGIGAGIGITVPFVLKKFVDDKITTSTPWLKPSVIIPLITGVACIVISRYTKALKKHNQKDMFYMYGVSATLTGLLNGFVPSLSASASLAGCPSCAQKAYGIARHQGGHTQNTMIQTLPSRFSPDYMTSTYYPNFQGTFVNRPQTMARGWGSDVTRNPMAAIPTTIPSNEIRA